MGYYDLAAIIDREINETQSPSVSAVGYSRGSLMFYVLGATRPEYNLKINVMISLVPKIHFINTSPVVLTLWRAIPIIDQVFNSIGMRITEFLGYNSTATRLIRAYCTYPVIGNEMCLNTLLFPLTGYDPEEVETSFVIEIISRSPAGTSWMEMLHISQLIRHNFAQSSGIQLS